MKAWEWCAPIAEDAHERPSTEVLDRAILEDVSQSDTRERSVDDHATCVEDERTIDRYVHFFGAPFELPLVQRARCGKSQIDAAMRLQIAGLDEIKSQATVVLRIRHLGLPVQRGMYSQTFDRKPVLSRWRLEDGVWRLFYLNENSRQAAEIVQAERLE